MPESPLDNRMLLVAGLLRSATVGICLALLMGCQPATDDNSARDRDPSAQVAAENAADDHSSAPKDVSLMLGSWTDVQRLIRDQQGKIVVVDLWSTWCIPCVREFPGLVQLAEAYPAQIACISVNLNFDGSTEAPTSDLREKVLSFLRKQEAHFQNVLCTEPDLELYDQLDLGAIPAVYVYDSRGELVKRFDNDDAAYGDEGFTYKDHIVPLVEELQGTGDERADR